MGARGTQTVCVRTPGRRPGSGNTSADCAEELPEGGVHPVDIAEVDLCVNGGHKTPGVWIGWV